MTKVADSEMDGIHDCYWPPLLDDGRDATIPDTQVDSEPAPEIVATSIEDGRTASTAVSNRIRPSMAPKLLKPSNVPKPKANKGLQGPKPSSVPEPKPNKGLQGSKPSSVPEPKPNKGLQGSKPSGAEEPRSSRPEVAMPSDGHPVHEEGDADPSPKTPRQRLLLSSPGSYSKSETPHTSSPPGDKSKVAWC